MIGAENLPARGPGLIVANHLPYSLALTLWARLERAPRLLADSAALEHPRLGPRLRRAGAIEIPSAQGARATLRALRGARSALARGELLAVLLGERYRHDQAGFPLERALERLVRRAGAPWFPVYLDGRRSLWCAPGLEPERPFHEVRAAVGELGTRAWMARSDEIGPLPRGFVRSARRHPLRFLFADSTGKRLTRLQALIGSVALARALRAPWRDQERVGLLLPPSAAGALANLAAALAGRSSVNLNYTLSAAAMASAVRQAGLKSVLTSRRFLARARIEPPAGVRVIAMEELAAGIGRGARLWAAALALLAPRAILERACGARRRARAGDGVTGIFSSGSTGEPKGVVLTHFNVGSNLLGAAEALAMRPSDRILGILPFFHSFGYLVLWAVARGGLGMAFHPNPLDAAGIAALVREHELTLVVATPTFLQLYLRRCAPADFASVRLVVAGAEKLPERLGRALARTFDAEVVEGYGASECAPVVAVGRPAQRGADFFQPPSPAGSVGPPLAGVGLRVVDLDAGLALPPGRSGMLLIKGPNVMPGYLGAAELTRAVLREGWYRSGDVASLDEAGILRLTDRLARFSKIGGEMVPHGRIEEALQCALGGEERRFVVTALPHARRGEQLVVLHTLEPERIPPLLAELSASGLPNLFIPREDHFLALAELPLLGTGKIDLRRAKELARAAHPDGREA